MLEISMAKHFCWGTIWQVKVRNDHMFGGGVCFDYLSQKRATHAMLIFLSQ
jgi:hypothetical protein